MNIVYTPLLMIYGLLLVTCIAICNVTINVLLKQIRNLRMRYFIWELLCIHTLMISACTISFILYGFLLDQTDSYGQDSGFYIIHVFSSLTDSCLFSAGLNPGICDPQVCPDVIPIINISRLGYIFLSHVLFLLLYDRSNFTMLSFGSKTKAALLTFAILFSFLTFDSQLTREEIQKKAGFEEVGHCQYQRGLAHAHPSSTP